jgi:threonine/homoserine/homoserine lactone efflux protein
MIYSFLYGFGTGLVLSSMLGTVFFSLVQTGISHGVRTCLYISTGVIISDIVLILITYFNADMLPKNGGTEMVVRLAGAAVLVGMGIANLRRRQHVVFPVLEARHKWMLAAKGFGLNFFNPGNFISWLSVSVLLAKVLHFSMPQRILFYSGALLAIFIAEVLIAYGARYIKRYISDRFLHWLNMGLGIVFIGFAIALVAPVVVGWLQRL